MQGSKSNTIWNNNLFYVDRIKSENARVGIETDKAANPWDFNMVWLCCYQHIFIALIHALFFS